METFYLKLSGNPVAGSDRERAAVALGRLLRMQPDQARALLQGAPSRIRRELTLERAERLQRKLLAGGVECVIRLVHRRRRGAAAPATAQTEQHWDEAEEIEVVLEGIGPPLDAETVQAVQTDTIQVGGEAVASAPAPRGRRWRDDRRLWLLAGVALLLSAGWGGWWFFGAPESGRPLAMEAYSTSTAAAAADPATLSRTRMVRLNRSIRVWMIQFGAGFDPEQVTLERVRQDLGLAPRELEDGWGRPLRYRAGERRFSLDSVGPDGVPGTADDLQRTFVLE